MRRDLDLARAPRLRQDAVTRRSLALAASLALVGCGAKTGLRIDHYPDDAGLDAARARDAASDATDASDAPDALTCVAGHFTLVRGTVEVMFVIDRSGSMGQNLDGSTSPPRRWDVLHDALAMTLPPFEDSLAMGAYAFPRRFDGSLTRSCQVARAIDVESALHNASGVLSVLTGSDPFGATPTAAALDFVGTTLMPRVTIDHSATIVLSTDGGPNCNVELNPSTCECTGRNPMGMPTCDGMPTECLDDARAASTIAALAAHGIATFVVGLDGDAEPAERMALDEMARAGGRPNTTPGEPAYYSARRPEQVRAALGTIERSITRCTLRSPSRPDDPDAIAVAIDGVTIPRDRTHLSGWDWGDMSFAQITFFGAACDRVAGSTHDPEVTVGCTDL